MALHGAEGSSAGDGDVSQGTQVVAGRGTGRGFCKECGRAVCVKKGSCSAGEDVKLEDSRSLDFFEVSSSSDDRFGETFSSQTPAEGDLALDLDGQRDKPTQPPTIFQIIFRNPMPSNLPNLRRLFVEARTETEESGYSRKAFYNLVLFMSSVAAFSLIAQRMTIGKDAATP